MKVPTCEPDINKRLEEVERALKRDDLGKYHRGRYLDLEKQYSMLKAAVKGKSPSVARQVNHILEIELNIEKIETRDREKKIQENVAKGKTGVLAYGGI